MFTGSLPALVSRDALKDLIETTGRKVSGSVSKTSDWVIAAAQARCKPDTTLELSVAALDEAGPIGLLQA